MLARSMLSWYTLACPLSARFVFNLVFVTKVYGARFMLARCTLAWSVVACYIFACSMLARSLCARSMLTLSILAKHGVS